MYSFYERELSRELCDDLPSSRLQDVAIDKIPSDDQVGVDSIVLFPQGSYGATEGNNIGGMRFHQGIITRVYKVCSNMANIL